MSQGPISMSAFGSRLLVGNPSRHQAPGGAAGLEHELLGALQAALEWRNLVRVLWVELGRPQVPGFPASRVQQILWGEQPPEEGFFTALLGALTSRSRSTWTADSLRNWLVHSGRTLTAEEVADAWHTAKAVVALTRCPTSALSSDAVPQDGVAPRSAATRSVEASNTPRSSAARGDAVRDLAVRHLLESITSIDTSPPNPDSIETEIEFGSALQQLKQWSQMSFRQLEERSKDTASGWLPRSSAADMLRRSTLPRADLLWSFTSACGLPREDQERWEAARARLEQRRRPSGRPLWVEAGNPAGDHDDQAE